MDELANLQSWYALAFGSNTVPQACSQPVEPRSAPLPSKERQAKENKTLFQSIFSSLKAAGISHTFLEHEPTRTSAEVSYAISRDERLRAAHFLQSAKVRGVSLESGAKAMLLTLPCKSGQPQEYALLVLSASRRLDWKVLRKELGRKTQLATEETVYSITGCVPGAVPPFGSLFCAVSPSAKVRTLLDPSLQQQGSTINFNAGLRTASIGMAVQDYIDFEKPTIMSFSS